MPTNEPKYVTHLGRNFLVIAQFPNSEDGVQKSNDYMAKHPKAGLLLDQDGFLLLSHSDDQGAGNGPTTVSTKAKRAIVNYGAGVCLEAYRQNLLGDGASTIGFGLKLTTNQADAAIDAGRELAGGE